MKHAIHKIVQARVVGSWTLWLAFGDGCERVVDLSHVLVGELFGPLRDEDLFNQVRVDPDAHTVVWPNGADFDPATLHDWPDNETAWRAQASKWSRVAEDGSDYEEARSTRNDNPSK